MHNHENAAVVGSETGNHVITALYQKIELGIVGNLESRMLIRPFGPISFSPLHLSSLFLQRRQELRLRIPTVF